MIQICDEAIVGTEEAVVALKRGESGEIFRHA